MRKMSTAARDELVTAPARRYAVCTRAEKTRILDEFEAVTGVRRKHAMRVLRTDATRQHAEGRAGRRIYDDASATRWWCSGRHRTGSAANVAGIPAQYAGEFSNSRTASVGQLG